MPYKKGEHGNVATEFKPGHKSSRTLPVGSITTRVDKAGRSRAWIKIKEPNVWIPRAQFIWMEHGGNIPEGFILHHKDDNTLNDGIENLALVSRATHINHHREKLLLAKIGLVLDIKDVTCSRCKRIYQAKAQRRNGLCDECRYKSNRENGIRYKKRIRAERRERESTTSEYRRQNKD